MATEELQKAIDLKATNKSSSIDILHSIVKRPHDTNHEESAKVKEQAILELGSLLAETKQAEELAGLIRFTRPFLDMVSKAKAAKMVRGLVDLFLDMEAGTGKEVELCRECINWATDEKRTFLRQALEARLIALYFETKKYQDALQLTSSLLRELKKLDDKALLVEVQLLETSSLLRELKKLDDKALLVEVQLLESKIYHALTNLPKARAALTSGRTTANGIYCPPKLQASLDLQSGVLHAAEERDFKTAYSYFYEAFEGYDSIDNPKALIALKYMLLMKIMLNTADEVQAIVSGKLALKYSGPDIEAMKSIAQASHKRSLADFQKTLVTYKSQLEEDPIVSAHLKTLYDNLLEQNLCRIIEPFSKVQVQHVANLIKLPMSNVEKKLSQMILDRKFHGILDQGAGVLVVFDETEADKTYETALETIQDMGKVVDALYNKAKKLS